MGGYKFTQDTFDILWSPINNLQNAYLCQNLLSMSRTLLIKWAFNFTIAILNSHDSEIIEPKHTIHYTEA